MCASAWAYYQILRSANKTRRNILMQIQTKRNSILILSLANLFIWQIFVGKHFFQSYVFDYLTWCDYIVCSLWSKSSTHFKHFKYSRRNHFFRNFSVRWKDYWVSPMDDFFCMGKPLQMLQKSRRTGNNKPTNE